MVLGGLIFRSLWGSGLLGEMQRLLDVKVADILHIRKGMVVYQETLSLKPLNPKA